MTKFKITKKDDEAFRTILSHAKMSIEAMDEEWFKASDRRALKLIDEMFIELNKEEQA